MRGLLLVALAAALLATFLWPWDSGGEKPPSGWDTALGTAAQVIGGATAVVFALLVVPVQNAAARYSPMFLTYISHDRRLQGVLAWTVVSLAYALAALFFGATPSRVAGASILTLMVVGALAWAALRVMRLLDPIELAHMVESDAQQQLHRLMANERARFDRTLENWEAATGRPAALRGHYPVPDSIIHYVHSRIQPLLSITAGAIEAGQVDVVEGVLISVTNLARAYLQERGTSATIDDPLISRLSEELFSLGQAAQRSTSLQVLPEVIRALGRTATAGVEVSSSIGVAEQNVALMPMGQLRFMAIGNLSNVNSVAPALAVEQIGSIIYQLLQRGLPSSTAGAIRQELAPPMQSALKPFALHVAAVGARWLMRLWTLASAVPGGHFVRLNIQETVEAFLQAYRSEPSTIEQEIALGPLLNPVSDYSSFPPTSPAGAAVAAGLLAASWPPDDELLEDIRRLGDTFVRELLWPAASGKWRDTLASTYATEQAVEMAVLLAAIASGTLQHPKAVTATTDRNSDAEDGENKDGAARAYRDTEREAAEKWRWLSTVLIGTCGGLEDAGSEDEIGRLDPYKHALTGASACIFAALACLERRQTEVLEDALNIVLDRFCKLGEGLVQKWPRLSAGNPVTQHLRMIGAWLLATQRQQWPERIARTIAQAEAPRHSTWYSRDYTYPTNVIGGSWMPPFISVNSQYAVPHYRVQHAFMADPHRERFEELVEQLAEAGRPERPEGGSSPG